MEGIALAPATTNPGTGETYEGSIYWVNQTSGQPQIGNSTIITNSKLPDGIFPYQFLSWGDGTDKWEVSAPGATLNAQTIPISGKSSAEFTSNGTLGLLGSDLTRLGNAVGGDLFRSCIDINPSTINIISQKPGGGSGTVQVNGTPGTTGQALGITPSAGFGWITPADLVPGIYSNSHYVNAGSSSDTLDAALIAIGSSQGQVVYFSAGTYTGSYTVSGKILMGWIAPPVADVRTICELTGSVTFDNTCQRIRLSNLQISGALTLQQTANNYYGGVTKASGGVIISGSGSHFFTDCEFAVPVSIDAAFSGTVSFYNCNFTGGNLFPNQSSPSQVFVSNCLGLASRSANATYLGFNLNSDFTSTQAASDTQTGFITLLSGRGTTGQALVSGGVNPPVWSTISGGGGGGSVTEVTANAPLSVVNGTTTPDITLNVSSITSTLIKELVCLDGTIDITTLPDPTGKTAQVSLANVGTSGLYTNVANITTNTKGQVTSVTSYGTNEPVLSLSVGTGLQNVGTAQNPSINNTGVISVSAGTGIDVTGTGSDPTISNSGVLSFTAGTGLTNVGTSQNPNVNNDGVLSFTAGTGLTNIGTAQNPTVNNDGVLELTAGTNITITGTKSNYTINASGGSAPTDYVAQVNANGGAVALNTVTPSSGSIILGTNAANVATIGSNNIVQGSGAFNFSTVPGTAPTSNTVIGFGAGAGQGNYEMTRMNILGVNTNANGFRQQQDGVAIGTDACADGACWESVVIGKQTASGLNDDRSVYIGAYTGRGHGGGYGNVAIGLNALDGGGTGSGNVAIGFNCGIRIQGDENTYIGANVGNQNYGTAKVESGITVIGRKYGDLASNNYDGFYMDGYSYTAGLWATSPAQITAGAPCLNIAGDLIVDNITRTGDLEFTNATLSGSSGGNSGQHLRLIINGTPYKIRLEDD